MSNILAELKQKAAQLPESERAELALVLIESLDGPADADVEEAWRVEIEHRVAQESLLILAVAHQRRHPGYWRRRVEHANPSRRRRAWRTCSPPSDAEDRVSPQPSSSSVSLKLGTKVSRK